MQHDSPPIGAPAGPEARLRFLAEVTGTVLGAAPLAEQARRLAAQVRAFLGVDASVIRLVEGEDLVLLASVGFDEERLAARLPVAFGASRAILETRRPVTIPDVRVHPSTAAIRADPNRYPPLGAAARAPLLAAEEGD